MLSGTVKLERFVFLNASFPRLKILSGFSNVNVLKLVQPANKLCGTSEIVLGKVKD
jgi:hypothetical protein